MPSDNTRAKARMFNTSPPGQHTPNSPTKYDPTNHQVQLGSPLENPASKVGETAKSPTQIGDLFKPSSHSIDPLTGETQGVDPHSELRGVADSIGDLNQVLRLMLVELSAQRPSMPLVIEGITPTIAAHNNDFYFLLDQKRAVATSLFLYNNSGQAINVAFEEAATPNDIPVANATQLVIPQIKIGWISIYCPIAIPVSRLKNQAKVGASIVMYAFGNPEWRHVWGEV